jgi:hypothetical protein
VATAEIILIAVIALLVVLPGIAGVIRGTVRSLLAFLGMLLGAVLIDGWQRSWQNWIVATFEAADPALLTWVVVATVFLAVFLFVGYGAPLLLPRRMLPERLTWGDRGLGLLIGLVTGLLVASYLLHYAAILRPDTPVMGLIDRSLVAQITWASLPWVMLALVVIMALSILGRAFVGPEPSKKPAAEEQPSAESAEEVPAPGGETARTADTETTETFEPTPLPGTRDLPNDHEPAPAQAEDAPAQAEPTSTDMVPASETPERYEPGSDADTPGEAAPPASEPTEPTEPAEPEKRDDDERDDAAPERR